MAAVPDWVTPEYIESITQKCLKSINIQVDKYEAVPASTEGLNYMSQLLRIRIDYKTNGQTEKISLYAKIKLNTALTASFANKFDNFQVETYFMQHIQPEINERLGKNFGPRLYHFDSEHDVLFLEDLSPLGFKPTPVHTFLGLEQCVLALEALAEMHGASYYIIQKHPEYKNKFPSLSDNKGLCDKLYENSKAALRKFMPLYGLSDELTQKLLKFKERYDEANGEIDRPTEGGLNVLNHCDSTKNNVLFSYKDGVAQEAKWLDFQTVCYNSFAKDLHNFISSSADADVFISQRELLLQKYHQRLQQIAPDIPNLTLERIKSEFEECNYQGLLVFLAFRPYVLGEKAVDFDRIFAGELEEAGFAHPKFLADVKKIIPYFDSIGAL